MKKISIILLSLVLISCNSSEKKINADKSKHNGLTELETDQLYKVLYSDGELNEAKKQSILVEEAYQFLSGIMGAKENFCLLIISENDWGRNAYSPIPGMPEYYKGNLIVGAGQNSMADGYEEMIGSFPEEITKELIEVYTNESNELDMKLFFDKLSIHELTHSFQDPKNSEGFSMNRWLEEIHANMGLYAFYKTKKPSELKYVVSLVDFSLGNPPPDIQYTSLTDFDTHYYEMPPPNYGFYQMKFTRAAQKLIDSLGNKILKPLNDFLIKYDETWKEKLSEEDFKKNLEIEVDPYFLEIIDNW